MHHIFTPLAFPSAVCTFAKGAVCCPSRLEIDFAFCRSSSSLPLGRKSRRSEEAYRKKRAAATAAAASPVQNEVRTRVELGRVARRSADTSFPYRLPELFGMQQDQTTSVGVSRVPRVRASRGRAWPCVRGAPSPAADPATSLHSLLCPPQRARLAPCRLSVEVGEGFAHFHE